MKVTTIIMILLLQTALAGCTSFVPVVDFYDALTVGRPYRAAVDPDEVVEMIVADSGRAFDPRVVEVFVESRAEIAKIHAEYLDLPVA